MQRGAVGRGGAPDTGRGADVPPTTRASGEHTRESAYATSGETAEGAMGETEASAAHTQQAGGEGPEEAGAKMYWEGLKIAS